MLYGYDDGFGTLFNPTNSGNSKRSSTCHSVISTANTTPRIAATAKPASVMPSVYIACSANHSGASDSSCRISEGGGSSTGRTW